MLTTTRKWSVPLKRCVSYLFVIRMMKDYEVCRRKKRSWAVFVYMYSIWNIVLFFYSQWFHLPLRIWTVTLALWGGAEQRYVPMSFRVMRATFRTLFAWSMFISVLMLTPPRLTSWFSRSRFRYQLTDFDFKLFTAKTKPQIKACRACTVLSLIKIYVIK